MGSKVYATCEVFFKKKGESEQGREKNYEYNIEYRSGEGPVPLSHHLLPS